MSMSNTTKRVKEIRRKTRRKFSSEEKIRIVLEGLRGDFVGNLPLIVELPLEVDLAVKRCVPGGALFHELGKQSGLVGGQPLGGYVAMSSSLMV